MTEPVPPPGEGAGREVACSEVALAEGEPVEATAPHAVSWVGVVVPGPWPPDAAALVPQQLRTALAALPGVRVVLLRGVGDGATAGGLLLAGTVPGRSWLREIGVEAMPQVLDRLADPSGDVVGRLRSGHDPGLGTLVTRPAVLVCTDGHEDPCCARLGVPAAVELQRRLAVPTSRLLRRSAPRADLWEVSDLDGHRFAPTATLLPSGTVLGGLGPDVAALADAVVDVLDGRPVLEGYRGRSTYPVAVQAAETAVRRHLAVLGVSAWPDDVRVDGDEAVDGSATARRVLLRHTGGRTFQVQVDRVETDLRRPVRCGAEPTPVVVWAAEVDADNPPGVYLGA